MKLLSLDCLKNLYKDKDKQHRISSLVRKLINLIRNRDLTNRRLLGVVNSFLPYVPLDDESMKDCFPECIIKGEMQVIQFLFQKGLIQLGASYYKGLTVACLGDGLNKKAIFEFLIYQFQSDHARSALLLLNLLGSFVHLESL